MGGAYAPPPGTFGAAPYAAGFDAIPYPAVFGAPYDGYADPTGGFCGPPYVS